ncbi:hypothetical protein [Pendulispora albinea]|uniref:Uncharacterized protein n=1 Tax=Pendulispora albinea TaxID=2741071 RepID=A0ABZ2M199_9BACT
MIAFDRSKNLELAWNVAGAAAAAQQITPQIGAMKTHLALHATGIVVKFALAASDDGSKCDNELARAPGDVVRAEAGRALL